MPVPSAYRLLLLALSCAAVACVARAPEQSGEPEMDPAARQLLLEFRREPDTVPTHWRGLIGEY